MKIRRGIATFALLAACVAPARADLIYDSGLAPGPFTSGITADSANISTVTSTAFAIATAAEINEVRFAGKYFPNNVAPAIDAFTIRFYDLSGAVPSASPLFTYFVGDAVNRTSTGIVDFNGQTVYSYDAFIPTTALAAGRYAFSVQDSTTPGGDNYFFWTYAFSPGNETFFGSTSFGTFNTSFSLLGPRAVPEPPSLALTGFGVLGLVAFARRRARAA